MKTAYEIAKRLGRDHSHLYKIKRGLRRPSPEYAKEIERVAEGEVGWRVRDLLPDLAELFDSNPMTFPPDPLAPEPLGPVARATVGKNRK